MDQDLHVDEAWVEAFLAPLQALQPAVRREAPPAAGWGRPAAVQDELDPAEDLAVAQLLAPLADVEPVTLPGPAARRARRRWSGARRVAILGVAAALATAATGFALDELLIRPANISPISPGQPFACANLVGAPATRAALYFTIRHVPVAWRLTRYPAPGTGGLGETTSPIAPPPGSIVEDVQSGPGDGVIVFLRGGDDPNAPPLRPPPPCGDSPQEPAQGPAQAAP